MNFMFLEFLSLKNIMRDVNCGLFLYSLMEDACIYHLFGICQYAAILKYLSVPLFVNKWPNFSVFCFFVFYKVAKFPGLCFDYLGGGAIITPSMKSITLTK